jgi:DNA mismatch repair protein MutS2
MRTARAEAKTLVAEANKQIENTIKVIRESQAERELTRLARREIDDFRETLDAPTPRDPEQEARMDAEMERIVRRQQNREKRKKEKKEKAAPPPPKPKAIEQGSKVRIKGQETVGEVTEVKGSKATVAFGQILSTVALERLEAISGGEYKAATRPTAPLTRIDDSVAQRRLQFTPRVDVRGLRPTEAIEAVEDFIDNALMIGVNEVSILHGKGTGALKSEIRRYLKSIPAIESATDDHADRGGAGITVVTFKQ